jgi:hypothetical protein
VASEISEALSTQIKKWGDSPIRATKAQHEKHIHPRWVLYELPTNIYRKISPRYSLKKTKRGQCILNMVVFKTN